MAAGCDHVDGKAGGRHAIGPLEMLAQSATPDRRLRLRNDASRGQATERRPRVDIPRYVIRTDGFGERIIDPHEAFESFIDHVGLIQRLACRPTPSPRPRPGAFPSTGRRWKRRMRSR